uniref:Putative c-type lectin n=1 Tax=Nyssomyia neivai TaxID=330878 RepID=A0A1L8DQ43_9DIPT
MTIRLLTLLFLVYIFNLSYGNLNTGEHVTGKTIYVSKIKKSWKDAQDYCSKNGYNLATIKSKKEQYEILIIITKWTMAQHIWVGGYKNLNGDHLIWINDGKPIPKERTQTTFSNWASGKPNSNKKDEMCMELDFSKAFHSP